MIENNKKKNIVIIGGGLSGLGIAHSINSDKYNITLLEKENKLGGKVSGKFNPQFEEHSVRTWINPKIYKLFYKMIDEFYPNFISKNLTVYEAEWGKQIPINFNFFKFILLPSLKYYFTPSFLKYRYNYVKITDAISYNKLNKKNKILIDKVLISLNGTGLNTNAINFFESAFSVIIFNRIIKRNKFYTHKPIVYNNLFQKWRKYLEDKNVVVKTNYSVEKIDYTSNKYIINNEIEADYLFMATEPNVAKKFFKNDFKNIFFNKHKSFGVQINIKKDSIINTIELAEISPWALVGNQYKINGDNILSVAVSNVDEIGLKIKKKFENCTQQEVIQEIIYQITKNHELSSIEKTKNYTLNYQKQHLNYNQDKQIWEISSYLFSQNPTSNYLPSKSKNYKNVYYAGEICRPYNIFIISKEYAVNTSLRAVREFYKSENENFTKYSYIKEKYSTFPYILFGLGFFLFKFRIKIKNYFEKYLHIFKNRS